jgi:hypothetical protein
LFLANSAAKQLTGPPDNKFFADGLEDGAELVSRFTYFDDGTMHVGEFNEKLNNSHSQKASYTSEGVLPIFSKPV